MNIDPATGRFLKHGRPDNRMLLGYPDPMPFFAQGAMALR
jgi:hypothetical protein